MGQSLSKPEKNDQNKTTMTLDDISAFTSSLITTHSKSPVMSQTTPETDSKHKETAALDSVPGDVAISIAAVVKDWGSIEGNFEAKEKAAK